MTTKPKRRLSCGLIAIILLSVVLAIIVLGIETMKRHYQNKAVAALSDSGRAELFKWLATPVDTPYYSEKQLAPLSEDLVQKRTEFSELAEKTADELNAVGPERRATLIEALVLGESLDPSQQELLDFVTKTGDELMILGLPLIRDQRYTMNSRRFPSNAPDSSAYPLFSVIFETYAIVSAINNKWDDVLGATELLTSLFRSDAGIYTNELKDNSLYPISSEITSLTSNSALLKMLLQSVTEIAPELEKGESDSAFFNDVIYTSHWMLKDGYIEQLPKTVEDYFRLNWIQYLDWVQHAPSISDPDREALAMLASFEDPSYWHQTRMELFLRRMNVGLLKPVVEDLLFHVRFDNVVGSYKAYKTWKSEARNLRVTYDTQRLNLALRITDVEGKTTATLEARVKEYLPEVPIDPWGQAYRYSTDKSSFYSTGPDTADSTADDVYPEMQSTYQQAP